MVIKALLDDITEALECSASEMNAYYDRKTGTTIFLNDDYLRQGAKQKQNIDELNVPNWEKDCLKQARAIVSDTQGRFVPLPGSDDIHEWAIMNRFALSLQGPLSEKIYRAIRGSGAFRKFEETLDKNGLREKWYRFREQALKDIAIAWCEENNIEFAERPCENLA